MRIFQSLRAIARSKLPENQKAVLECCMQTILRACDFPDSGHAYDPEQDGFPVLLERGDFEAPLSYLGLANPFHKLAFESIVPVPKHRCFICYYFTNNQFGLALVVPDEAWLSARDRRHIADHIETTRKEDG